MMIHGLKMRQQLKRILICTSFGLLFMASGMLRAQAPRPGYVLQFSDDFTGTVVDTTRWNYRTDAKINSAQLPANVTVADGKLTITPRKQDFAGLKFTGGGIISKASFRYGYYQVNAQTVGDPGWHSSFWAMAGDGSTTYPMNARTEIDDFEIDGIAPEKVSMGYLVWKDKNNLGATRCDNAFKPGYSTATSMHAYGFEWTEEDIIYYLDGKKICSQPYPATEGTHDLVHIWLTVMASKAPVKVSGHSPSTFAHLRYYIRDYYIGVKEPGYIEYGKDWSDGDVGGYSDLGTRQSCNADAIAVWAPTILEAGNYDVQLWNTHFPAGADLAPIATVTHKGGQTSKAISARQGGVGWLDLGTFAFDKGTAGSFSLRNGNGGCISASMVKFVRK